MGGSRRLGLINLGIPNQLGSSNNQNEAFDLLVEGAVLECTCGDELCFMIMDNSNGVYSTNDHPIVTADDCIVPDNIESFGMCRSTLNPENKNENGEKKTCVCVPSFDAWRNTCEKGKSSAAEFAHMDSFLFCTTGRAFVNPLFDGQEYINLLGLGILSDRNYWRYTIQVMWGFDKRSVDIMMQIYDKLGESYSGDELVWAFSRTLSNVAYGEGSAWWKKNIWKNGAGQMYGYGKNDEKNFFTKALGLSEEDYLYLRYQIRIQQQIAGAPEKNSWLALFNGEDLEKRDAAVRQFLSINGITIYNTDDIDQLLEDHEKELEILWNSMFNRYVGKPDFAHMMYTIAANLAASNKVKSSYGVGSISWTSNSERIDWTGWLGDACLAVDGKPPSFGNDDYIADLDAVNLAALMRNNEMTIEQAMIAYYTEVNNDPSHRVDMFLQEIGEREGKDGYTYIEEIVLKKAGVKNVEDLIEKGWPDTYNFLMSLQNGDSIMGAYA